MDQTQIEEEEYEYQHFGPISSTLYILSLKSLIIDTLNRLFENLKKSIEEDCGEVSIDLLSARGKYEEAVNESIKTLEGPVKQFFSIPKNVLLPSDKVQKKYKNNLDELKAKLERYEEIYLKQKIYTALLKSELSDLDKVNPLKQNVDKLLQIHERNRSDAVYFRKVSEDYGKLINKEDIEKLKFHRYISDENKSPNTKN